MLKRAGTILLHIVLMIFLAATCFPQEKEREESLLLREAIGLLNAERYQEAINLFFHIVRTSVEKDQIGRAHIYLAYAYFTTEDLESAKIHIEKALEFRPDVILDPGKFSQEFVSFFGETKRSSTGIGYFESTPAKAFVFIDGKQIGVTPLKKELLARKYEVRMVRWGYIPQKFEFKFEKNKINHINMDFTRTKNWKGLLRSAIVFIGFTVLINSL